MPIEKVAVVHKFGIISHSQRLQLEDRLSKKSTVNAPCVKTRRLPYDISEDFVSKFNDSSDEEQLALENVASKMIARAKRRAGILEGGVGEHVDLPKAWTELGLLAQCNGPKIQEESLDLLIMSLQQSPPAVDQLPSLFYLAKSSLHWLRKSALNQPYLRTGELKLIKMGHLTFIRLYYHLLVQELKEFQEEKDSLFQYLGGIPEQQEVYRSFPGALLPVRYITQVGYLICSENGKSRDKQDAVSPPVEDLNEQAAADIDFHNQGKEEQQAYNEAHEPSPPGSPSAESTIDDVSPSLWHALDVWRSVTYQRTGLSHALEGLRLCGTGLSTESWLDVACSFQILVEGSKQDLTVLETFQSLASGILSKPAVLSEMHARDVHVCYTCLSSLTGHQSAQLESSRGLGRAGKSQVTASDYQSVGKTPSFVHDLQDFVNFGYERAKPSEHDSEVTESVDARDDSSSEASFADVSSVDSAVDKNGAVRHTVRGRTYIRGKNALKGVQDSSSESEHDDSARRSHKSKPRSVIKKRDAQLAQPGRTGTEVRFNVEKTQGYATDKTQGDATERTKTNKDTQHSAGMMERTATKESLCSAATQASSVSIPLLDEHSDLDSVSKTDTSIYADLPGLRGWSWELAYLYADSMVSICLHGATSTIQKIALLGNEANSKVTLYGNKGNVTPAGLGLVSLLNLTFPNDTANPRKDWSWRVRFAALQGLVRVCRHCDSNSAKDGLRTVAWNALMRHHSTEKDVRVLEALKVAQIETYQDKKISSTETTASSFPAWMATNLSTLMLPALPPIVPRTTSALRPRSRAVPHHKSETANKEQRHPSLRQEILLATATRERTMDYNTRMNLDLVSVIETQWRKQLHAEEGLENSIEAMKIEEKIDEERKKEMDRKEVEQKIVKTAGE